MFKIIDTLHARSAFEQGLAYASQCASQIHHCQQAYRRLFEHCDISWLEATEKATSMLPAIQALDGTLIEEMRGIAESAGLAFEDILTLNCRTEILPPEFLGAASSASATAIGALLEEGECTAIALAPQASGDGSAWFAQNWDWIGTQRQAVVLLKGRSWNTERRTFMTMTEAGMLAKIGLGIGPEENRVALGLNIVRSRLDGSKAAIPVHALLRHLLTQPSLRSIRVRMNELATSFGFGAGSNIPCIDTSGEVASLEISPQGWQEWPAQQGVMTHTNHFLSDPLIPIQHPTSGSLSSEPRLATAKRLTTKRPLDRDDLQTLLRDESQGYLSVCRQPDPTVAPDASIESVAGVVINVNQRAFWVAPHVPSTVAFERVH